MKRYDLVLDEPEKVYFSGDDVRGHVIVCLDSNITVQGITIRLVGEAVVAVPDTTRSRVRRRFNNKISSPTVCGGRDSDHAWRFSASEKYFHHKEYLFGHKYSSFKEQLWKGSHDFAFNYTLPAQLPTSFNGRFGFVRYYCESSVERWRHKDTKRTYFSVSSVTDINLEPKADSPSRDENCTNSCFFCLPRGTIVASSELRSRGHACGQTVRLTLDIHNMSDRPVTKTFASIVQLVTYSCSQNIRHQVDRRVIENRGLRAVPEGEYVHDVVQMTIPPLPPSSLCRDNCKLITVQYRLEVTLEIERSRDFMRLYMDLIIGNIPLRKYFGSLEKDSGFESKKQFRIPFKLHKYKDIPQSWSERGQNPEASQCVYQATDFCPAYPYYREKVQPN